MGHNSHAFSFMNVCIHIYIYAYMHINAYICKNKNSGYQVERNKLESKKMTKPLQNPAEVRAEAWLGGQTKGLSKSKLANIWQKATRETWFRKSADESVSGKHSIPSSKTLKKKNRQMAADRECHQITEWWQSSKWTSWGSWGSQQEFQLSFLYVPLAPHHRTSASLSNQRHFYIMV